jgi:hypothetical protein
MVFECKLIRAGYLVALGVEQLPLSRRRTLWLVLLNILK